MEGDEGRVEEREREDDQTILKINTFHEPFPLLSSLSPLPPSPPYQTQGLHILLILECTLLVTGIIIVNQYREKLFYFPKQEKDWISY